MDDNRFALAIALVSLFFICLLLFYNGQWNIALYSESEVITSAVYKNYRLILSPASGIALALGAISTLEVLWLVPEKDRERLNHLALWIFLTVLGNSFTAYLISKRPGCTIELGFWIQSVGLTLATIAWYYMLMWVFRTRRFSKMKREEVKTEESEHKVAQPKEDVTTTMLVLNTLRSIGCSPQIEQRGNLVHAIFTFQGEEFTIESNDQCYFITIYDTWWHSLSIYSDVDDIADLHRTINLANQYINCTLLYTTNNEIEEIGVHSRRTILFVKEIKEIDKYLISVLNDFFKAQRLVLTELEKCKVEK